MSSPFLSTLNYPNYLSQPSASTYWQTASFEAWPPRSQLQPIVNYVAPPSAQQQQAEKLVAAAPANNLTPYGAYFAAQSQPEKLTAPPAAERVKQTVQPKFGVLTPYGALQATTQGKLLLLNSPYYAAYSLPLAYVAPSVGIAATTPSTTTTSTAMPATAEKVEDDAESEEDTIETLQKLQAKPQTSGDLKSDQRLRAAVSRINSNYVIEEIVSVPGKHVISSTSQSTNSRKQLKNSAKLRTPVKVEATGRTSTSSKNFPQIPFGNYFLPYRPAQAKAIQGRKQAALILEPHSKALVGNGGTAISTPFSRALLKKGVPTNVYFNPESVAIAGVGGKAHAAADLELDLFN
ncbi:GH15131 [Drosophila grimshawi]|uniref:GH15131 n=1 Tax=Drosophila grimshawi TaxID=7222 RepID=B4IYB4_DROGR|nr:GH15131 [Drosophila grimshawi]